MSEVANIPQLRFPGFSDEWEERPLKDVSTFFNGKAYKQAELLSSGKYPVLRVGNFFTNNSWYYSNLELDENKYCDNGDLLYAWSASFGPRIWAGEKVIYHYHIWKVINHSQVTKKFLFIVLDNETAKMKAQSANGFALLHITKGTIENWKINLPTRQEQQKIAAFLTAVDSKIEQLSKKKALLGEYKKGLMQQIFSQAIRFKADDGSDFPNWEEKKLGDFDDLVHGDGDWILSQDITKNGKYEIVQLGNIGFGLFVDKPLKTISEDKFTEINGTQIRKGDLLINRMVDSKLYCCLLKSDDDFITSVDVCWIRKNEYFVNYFLMNLILFKKNQNKLLNLSSGSGRVRISKNNLFNRFSFELPSIEEQTKIANFLSSIDNKIEQVGKQLDESKQFKKALLQQMFV